MKNSEVRALLTQDNFPQAEMTADDVIVINPGIHGDDYEQFHIYDIGLIVSPYPCSDDTIIVVSSHKPFKGDILMGKFLTDICDEDVNGNVQVFVPRWEGQEYGYFEIDRIEHREHKFRVILGAWICWGII